MKQPSILDLKYLGRPGDYYADLERWKKEQDEAPD